MWKAREAYAILDLWCSFPVINCPFNGKHKCIASQSIIGRGWLQVTDTLGELLIDYREERERERRHRVRPRQLLRVVLLLDF